MRRRTTCVLASFAAALIGGCSTAPTTRVATLHPAEHNGPLWSPGVGDALGAAAFRGPVITAKLNQFDSSNDGFASVPTDN